MSRPRSSSRRARGERSDRVGSRSARRRPPHHDHRPATTTPEHGDTAAHDAARTGHFGARSRSVGSSIPRSPAPRSARRLASPAPTQAGAWAVAASCTSALRSTRRRTRSPASCRSARSCPPPARRSTPRRWRRRRCRLFGPGRPRRGRATPRGSASPPAPGTPAVRGPRPTAWGITLKALLGGRAKGRSIAVAVAPTRPTPA